MKLFGQYDFELLAKQKFLLLEQEFKASKKQTQALDDLGVKNLKQLLEYVPFRFEDNTKLTDLSQLKNIEEGKITALVTLESINFRPTRNPKLKMLTGKVRDKSLFDGQGSVSVLWFNQPWLMKQLKVGDWMLIHGQVKHKPLQIVISKTEVGKSEAPTTLESIYPASDSITSKTISRIIQTNFKHLPFDWAEPLPAWIRTQRGLCSKREAILEIHKPLSIERSLQAHQRLAFEELLVWELGKLQQQQQHAQQQALSFTYNKKVKQWQNSLPFTLTKQQEQAVTEISQDLEKESPMDRLLMGEVGTGKTIVALSAMLQVAYHNHQAILLAPTETLARQHFLGMQKLLPADQQPSLLISSLNSKENKQVREEIANGKARIIIGTHSLLGDVSYPNLGLVVIDEQHRFGVEQRGVLLKDRTRIPHTLHMSATPIPRSLALSVYGNLQLTQITDKPDNRKAPTTSIVSEKNWGKVKENIKKVLLTGRQVFIVCPAIEENQLQVANVMETFIELEELFKEYNPCLLHGNVKEAQQTMEDFNQGTSRLMVATTVIEVGVNVPNATLMVIRGAERFGMAQLHQLRGRVGRGSHVGHCIMVGDPSNPRLKVLKDCDDGFKLAEEDLKLRGFGDLLGTRQHGLQGFRIAKLPQDQDLLEQAYTDAKTIIDKDPKLEFAEHQYLAQLWNSSHGSIS